MGDPANLHPAAAHIISVSALHNSFVREGSAKITLLVVINSTRIESL